MAIGILLFGSTLFLYIKNYCLKRKLKIQKEEMDSRVYELAILKEIGDRIGYSLNIQEIAEVITGSLGQFIRYTAVSYMLISGEKTIFKIHLEESASKEFVEEIKDKMIKSLSALINKRIKKKDIKKIVSGAVIVSDVNNPVRSFFNIPLVIGDRVEGVLTVASVKPGLYKEEEMTILYKIVRQASMAVTRLEEVVKTEQRKLNAMVESITEGIIMTDRDFRILVANPAVKKALGIKSDKQDLTIFDFIDNLEGSFDIRGKLEKSVKTKKVLFSREVLINKKFWQIITAPVKSTGEENKEILGGVVIFHDMSKEKEIEQMRQNFTSMMVHELRSPLTGIKKAAEYMRQEEVRKNKKTYDEYMKMIHNDASEMINLVNDLLDVAKIEVGKFEIKKQPADIKKTIKERLIFFTPSAKEKNIKLRLSFDDNLKKFNFDPTKISQVLNNLISNALKFTSTGGNINVQVLRHEKNKKIKKEATDLSFNWFIKEEERFADLPDSAFIAITDTGEGIAKEDINDIFDKFKQLERKDIKEYGTGLGLAIVKGIVNSHGGMAGVSSRQGEGSSFYFTLPL